MSLSTKICGPSCAHPPWQCNIQPPANRNGTSIHANFPLVIWMHDAYCEVTCFVCGCNRTRSGPFTLQDLYNHIRRSHARDYGVEYTKYEMVERGIVRKFFGENVRRMEKGEKPVPGLSKDFGKMDGEGNYVPIGEEAL